MGKITQAAQEHGLTDRQERFCRHYVIHHNATKAAIEAKYGETGADRAGSRLLRNVRVATRICQLEDEAAQRLELKLDAVLRELAMVAFGRIDQICHWGPKGVELRPMNEVPVEARAAVARLQHRVFKSGHSLHIRMHNKIRALDCLARHLGGYRSTKQAASPLDQFSGMTDEELRAQADALMEARVRGTDTPPARPDAKPAS